MVYYTLRYTNFFVKDSKQFTKQLQKINYYLDIIFGAVKKTFLILNFPHFVINGKVLSKKGSGDHHKSEALR